MCTNITIKDSNSNVYTGRTNEQWVEAASEIVFMPRKFKSLRGVVGDHTFESKYATLLLNEPGFIPNHIFFDGLNEVGLSFQTLYFPGYAEYNLVDATDVDAEMVDVYMIAHYLVSVCKTVQDVRNEINRLGNKIVGVHNISTEPMHVQFNDPSGDCIVLEPQEGKLKIKENPKGILSNSPALEFHLENLKTYVNLTPIEGASDTYFNGNTNAEKLTPHGGGTGLLGLPGDFTPTSRFVRASFFSEVLETPKNQETAVLNAFTILNSFDIVPGAVRKIYPQEMLDNNKMPLFITDNNEVTTCSCLTCVKDLTNTRYYYKDHKNQNIRVVDFTQFDLDATESKSLLTYDDQVPKFIEVTL